jgi:hypothetical protein
MKSHNPRNDKAKNVINLGRRGPGNTQPKGDIKYFVSFRNANQQLF